MCFQVPIEAWLAPKDPSGDEYITKGGFKIFLKTSKGKVKDKGFYSMKYMDAHQEYWYNDWHYYYAKSISKPNYAKGKYYFAIKNTTRNKIKFKYSVKGYTEYASKASLKSKVTAKSGKYVKAGSIGPGIPLHISRFFPRFQMRDRPSTEVRQVYHLAEVARERLKYVYTGNC